MRIIFDDHSERHEFKDLNQNLYERLFEFVKKEVEEDEDNIEL